MPAAVVSAVAAIRHYGAGVVALDHDSDHRRNNRSPDRRRSRPAAASVRQLATAHEVAASTASAFLQLSRAIFRGRSRRFGGLGKAMPCRCEVVFSPCWTQIDTPPVVVREDYAMRTGTRPFRLTSAVAIAALLAAPWPAMAQGAPPPPPMAAQNQQAGDPPERVGRLAQINGSVSFHTQDEDAVERSDAELPGDRRRRPLDRARMRRREIEVSASRIVMAPSHRIRHCDMNDTASRRATAGRALSSHPSRRRRTRLFGADAARTGTLLSPGRYGVAAGDTENPTTVTVIEGSARVEAPVCPSTGGAQSDREISCNDTFQGGVGPAQRDGFLTAMLESERPRPPQGVPAPPAGGGGDAGW